jgi:hypothetical protein
MKIVLGQASLGQSLAAPALRLPPPSACLKLSVVIPVRNEAESLTKTLASLACQAGVSGAALDPASYEVLLLANNCTDETAEVVRCFARRTPNLALHVAEISLPPEIAHVGTARKLLMDEACRRLLSRDQYRGVITSTDGDTRVAPDWVAHTLAETAAGADAVGGRIRVERRRGEDREARLYSLRDTAYQRGLARLEHLLDPDPADPWPRHHQFFGGSLGITALAYQYVGGLPPLPCLEDVALGDALRRVDARIRHSPAVRVSTSSRQEGRTALGLSSQLREWGQMGRLGQAHWVEQPAAVMARFRARHILRSLRQTKRAGLMELSALAEELAVPLSMLQEGFADPHQPFGALWADIMKCHMQPNGVWAGRWPLIEITEALPDLRRRLTAYRK